MEQPDPDFVPGGLARPVRAEGDRPDGHPFGPLDDHRHSVAGDPRRVSLLRHRSRPAPDKLCALPEGHLARDGAVHYRERGCLPCCEPGLAGRRAGLAQASNDGWSTRRRVRRGADGRTQGGARFCPHEGGAFARRRKPAGGAAKSRRDAPRRRQRAARPHAMGSSLPHRLAHAFLRRCDDRASRTPRELPARL